ncbi:MAG: hypothetical protein LBM19_02235 [Holosporales bacterium]|jgi:adenylate cyclase|nr:hypothetical protein [Holosporales bacterium]
MFRNRKLKIDILAAFSLLICLTVACEILYSTKTNKDLVLEFEKDYFSKKISATAVGHIDAYLKELETIANILSQNYVADENDKFENFDKLLLESVKRIPYMVSIYIGLSDGSFLQARPIDKVSTFHARKGVALPSYVKYATRKIGLSDKSTPVETWNYLNEDFGFVAKESFETTYDPRKRNWYVEAELNRKLTWSEGYIFSTTGTPGITLSRPLKYDVNDSAVGVIGVDIELSDFKGLLESVKASKNSKVYLINMKNEILCLTDGNIEFAEGKDENTEELALPRADSTTDAVLHAASQFLLGADKFHAMFKVKGVSYVASIKKLSTIDAFLLLITPQADFTENFEKVQYRMLIISIFIFLLSFGMVSLLSKRISDPISSLCNQAKAIGDMKWEEPPGTLKSNILEIQELSNAMNSMKLSVSTFTKYAPKDLVRKLLNRGIQPELGGKIVEITMLFSDIEKFSTVSENLPAEYLILHLSEYFNELTKKIMERNGIIDKYIGDSIMAIWGAPTPNENQVIDACYAALECQDILKGLRKKWEALGKPPLPTRIGLHTGQAIVGNIGSQDRMNFTAIGDAVNVASRLEGVNKFYGTEILASENVEAAARGKVLFRAIDKVAVKGKATGLAIFEPLCMMKNADDKEYYKLIELSAKSKEAFELYQNQQFKSALKIYGEIIESFPARATAIIPVFKRCKECIETPPEEWDGINRLTSK